MKSLEEAAKSVGRIDWDEFVEAICESWERAIEEFRHWVRHHGEMFAEAEAKWAEASGKPPMTKEEKKQAFMDYVLGEEDENEDGDVSDTGRERPSS